MQISQSIPEEKLTDYVSVDDMELCDKIWKPFTEITLTDEIAKLRPLVKFWDRVPDDVVGTLIGVHSSQFEVYYRDGGLDPWEHAELATPKEIQEAGE